MRPATSNTKSRSLTQPRQVVPSGIQKTMPIALFIGLGLVLLTTNTVHGAMIIVDDWDGTLGNTRAPVVAAVKLTKQERGAVSERRLELVEVTKALAGAKAPLPVQIFATNEAGTEVRLCWLLPPGPKGLRSFALEKARSDAPSEMVARPDLVSGQFDLTEPSHVLPVCRFFRAQVIQ